MIRRNHLAIALSLCGAAWFFLSGSQVHADDAADTQRQLQQLREQNEKLQEQLRQQQLLIESLSRTVGEIQATNALRSQEIEHLESAMKGQFASAEESIPNRTREPLPPNR